MNAELGIAGFPRRLALARRMRDINQADLARSLGWDTQSRISNYENGKREPNLSDIVAIATLLRVDPAWLIFGTGTPSHQGPPVGILLPIKDGDVSLHPPTHTQNLCPIIKTTEVEQFMKTRGE
jgi:transcriptional regulator with XRE-family HTH domain